MRIHNPRDKGEQFNALTHLVGLCLLLCISWVVVQMGYAKNWENAVGVTCFTVGMMLMYVASILYHFWPSETKGKEFLRRLDHIAIYIFIASSDTPICMQLIEDEEYVAGWVSLGVIWLLAMAGIAYKLCLGMKYPRLSLWIYLLLGWSVLFLFPVVRDNLQWHTLGLIAAEGVAYTIGVYFFIGDKAHTYYHGIWHLFVILGTLLHWAAVFFMTWPYDEGLWAV